MNLKLHEVNSCLVAINGAEGTEIGILRKESTKQFHKGRAVLILARECLKVHLGLIQEAMSEQTSIEERNELLNSDVSVSCEKIAWSKLEGIDIDSVELELLMCIIDFEA